MLSYSQYLGRRNFICKSRAVVSQEKEIFSKMVREMDTCIQHLQQGNFTLREHWASPAVIRPSWEELGWFLSEGKNSEGERGLCLGWELSGGETQSCGSGEGYGPGCQQPEPWGQWRGLQWCVLGSCGGMGGGSFWVWFQEAAGFSSRLKC